MGTERMDVLAIHRATGARFVFGHSYGGLIALEVARECNTFQKLALYEPGVSIGGSIGVDWMESYARHLRQGEREEAFVDFTVGSRPRGSRTLPRWLMKNLLRMVIRRPDRERMYRLLSENLREHQQIAKLDDSYPSYRTIRGDTLLMCGGTRGSSTACQTIETLAAVIPHPVTRRFAKLDHFGPIRKGPGDVAQAVALFFAARSSEHGSSGRRSGRSA
jgi:pimeloyl-ACP methyl ester carboxylesterase